jgi:hypothetical protein
MLDDAEEARLPVVTEIVVLQNQATGPARA